MCHRDLAAHAVEHRGKTWFPRRSNAVVMPWDAAQIAVRQAPTVTAGRQHRPGKVSHRARHRRAARSPGRRQVSGDVPMGLHASRSSSRARSAVSIRNPKPTPRRAPGSRSSSGSRPEATSNRAGCALPVARSHAEEAAQLPDNDAEGQFDGVRVRRSGSDAASSRRRTQGARRSRYRTVGGDELVEIRNTSATVAAVQAATRPGPGCRCSDGVPASAKSAAPVTAAARSAALTALL